MGGYPHLKAASSYLLGRDPYLRGGRGYPIGWGNEKILYYLKIIIEEEKLRFDTINKEV
jgi:hypothetical protein